MEQEEKHLGEANVVYDNTPTVVAVIVPKGYNTILMVRRGNEPKKGLLGLPGGYHMRGETWQMAGAREVYEETGYVLTNPEAYMKLLSMETDEYGNNLVIALWEGPTFLDSTWSPDPAETQEVVFQDYHIRDTEFAFPRHWLAVKEYFAPGAV